MNDVLTKISQCGIVPVIKINDAQKAIPLADALKAGGIDIMEITFRTQAAKSAIECVFAQRPDITLGAGTVINPDILKSAQKSGAKFIVSPGLNPDTVKAAQEIGLPILPGVITPTEIERGLSLGLSIFKFFPAENFGGIKTVNALAAPYGGVKFVPTGGINEKNAADYFKSDKVFAVGGSWMVPEKLIDGEDWAGITKLTRQAVELLRSFRAEGENK